MPSQGRRRNRHPPATRRARHLSQRSSRKRRRTPTRSSSAHGSPREITKAVDRLFYKFSAGDSDFVEGVTQLMTVYPTPDDVERLFSFTTSSDNQVRLDAAQAIVELGPTLLWRSELKKSSPTGYFAMESRYPEVLRTILPALDWFSNPNHPECKKAFACALAAMGNPDEGSLRMCIQDVGKVQPRSRVVRSPEYSGNPQGPREKSASSRISLLAASHARKRCNRRD